MKNNTIFIKRVSSVIIVFLLVFVTIVCFSGDKLTVNVASNTDEPIYFGNRNSNTVALMFNCYEGRDIIEKIAETLNTYGFKATFFFGGCFADDNYDLLISLAENGHEIANHGYFHKKHSKLTIEENIMEIKKTHDMVYSLTGIKMQLFAPPYGDFATQTLTACKNLDYKVIMWSKDTVDWLDKNADNVYNKATKAIKCGDFVLMHPFEHTLNALPKILNYYINNGIVVGTVSQCLER